MNVGRGEGGNLKGVGATVLCARARRGASRLLLKQAAEADQLARLQHNGAFVVQPIGG